MPLLALGDLQRRELSLVCLVTLCSLLLSWQSLLQLPQLPRHLAPAGAGRGLVRGVKALLAELSDWLEWLDDLATSLETEANPYSPEDEEESRMVIGLQDSAGKMVNGTEEQEHFASSSKPRRKRTSEILFRVGEIVFHREYEVRGVVLGWDREARAPLSWLRQVYGPEQTSLYTDPHYTVICDTNQMAGVANQVHYFAQSLLDNDSIGEKVTNPLLDSLFDGFDSLTGRYLMSKQLRRIYPKD